jgi:hypothetical protein
MPFRPKNESRDSEKMKDVKDSILKLGIPFLPKGVPFYIKAKT